MRKISMMTSQLASVAKPSHRLTAHSMPSAVATPLPPLNRKNTG